MRDVIPDTQFMNPFMTQIIHNSRFKCHFMLCACTYSARLKHIRWCNKISFKFLGRYRIMNIIALRKNPGLRCSLSLSA